MDFNFCFSPGGVNGLLLVTLTGSDSSVVTEVALVEAPGSGEIVGSVTTQGDGDVLVQFQRIPSVAFVVRVRGQDNSLDSPVIFQRQSPTNLKASNLTVTVSTHPGPC